MDPISTTRRHFLGRTTAAVGLIGAGTMFGTPSPAGAEPDDRWGLLGAWRARVTIDSGPLAGIPFQFLVTYAAGGGMVESSNFDEATPVPPAYGSWVATGPWTFRSTYVFFTTNPPSDPGTLPTAGWAFSGSGKLREQITIAHDGTTYTSHLYYQLYDTTDNALPGQSGAAHAMATRIAPEPFTPFGP
jgi:hypothetical protein